MLILSQLSLNSLSIWLVIFRGFLYSLELPGGPPPSGPMREEIVDHISSAGCPAPALIYQKDEGLCTAAFASARNSDPVPHIVKGFGQKAGPLERYAGTLIPRCPFFFLRPPRSA